MKVYHARAPPASGLTDINPNTLEDKMKNNTPLPAEFEIPAEIYKNLTDEQKAEIYEWRKRYFSDDADMVALRRMDRHSRIGEYDRKGKNGKQYTASLDLSYDSLCEGAGSDLPSDFDLEKLVEDRDAYAVLRKALASLTDKERYIIFQIYLNGRTQRDLAAELKKSHIAILKEHRRILKKLKKYF